MVEEVSASSSKVIIAFLIAFFPIVGNASAGVAALSAVKLTLW
jgi:ABC-type nitrate/sulfonate/bicarbonate transport system permease component